jgi:hypothetical protein
MIRSPDPSRKGRAPERALAQTLLESALAYHRRGWAIIPTRGKKAACKWERFQTSPPDEAELRKLFRLPGVDGLAVVLGAASGGLVCRDFDTLESYKRWADRHPKFAKTLPTVKTARGRHVYFRGPEKYRDFGDGEYRGDSKHYAILPPSRHPSGAVYKWITSLPDGKLPRIDPWKSGLMVDGTQSTQSTQEVVCSGGSTSSVSPVSSTSSVPSTSSEPSVCSVFPVWKDSTLKGLSTKDQEALREAIAATQPEAEGQRHRGVFLLCRHLKAVPSLANAAPAKLRPVVEEWHRRALPFIRTKEFSETWADFVSAWDKVTSPAGRGPVDEAFRRAKAAKSPPKAARLYAGEPKVVLLAALCRELQRRAGADHFYLDCRTAGKLLDVPHKQAWRWLNMLCADEVLEAGEKGSRARHLANQYRYVAWKRADKGPR